RRPGAHCPRQRFSDGVGVAPDALVLSRRQRFRATQGGACSEQVTEHSETRFVPYPADLMFQVVADVEKYPEFLPWVVALRVKSRNSAGISQDILIAEMAVGYGALRQRYTSRVTLDRTARTVDVVEIEGPFRQLENHWRFTPAENGCDVDFRIAFE